MDPVQRPLVLKLSLMILFNISKVKGLKVKRMHVKRLQVKRLRRLKLQVGSHSVGEDGYDQNH